MLLMVLLDKRCPHTILKVVVIFNHSIGANTFFWDHNDQLFFGKLLLREISDPPL